MVEILPLRQIYRLYFCKQSKKELSSEESDPQRKPTNHIQNSTKKEKSKLTSSAHMSSLIIELAIEKEVSMCSLTIWPRLKELKNKGMILWHGAKETLK